MLDKNFVPIPNVLVDSALRACVALQPGLALDQASRVLYQAQGSNAKVTIFSGGGSGHEPGHAGYVAHGMLDAAVCGPIFASPNAKHVRTGLRLIQSPRGSVVIVKNYTGDRLNFGLAIEEARAYDRNSVEMVVVQDDVAVPRSRSGLVGRRGLAGVVLVHKVAGASAIHGLSQVEVTENARFVADRLATIGVSLDSCSVPGVRECRKVAAGEMELGMGIHNEPGTRRIPCNGDTSSLVATLLSAILNQDNKERGYLNWSVESQFVLLVNNLGGLPRLELYSLTEHVLSGLRVDYGIVPRRTFSGTYLSSLDGPGFSVTLLALPPSSSSDSKTQKILELLDAPTECVNWMSPIPTPSAGVETSSTELNHQRTRKNNEQISVSHDPIPYDKQLLRDILDGVNRSLRSAEPDITRYDIQLGDGDCGTTLLDGSSALVKAFGIRSDPDANDSTDLIADMQLLTDTLGVTMGGTSCALYSIFFSGFVSGLQQHFKAQSGKVISVALFSRGLVHGLATLKKYTSAGIGDRTMMDALIPFVDALDSQTSGRLADALDYAVDAARKGCEETRRMQSRYGRSTYVSAAESGVPSEAKALPDPGACGVVAIVQGALDVIKARE